MVRPVEPVAVFQQQTHIGNKFRNRLVDARLKLFSYWSGNNNTQNNSATSDTSSAKHNILASVHRHSLGGVTIPSRLVRPRNLDFCPISSKNCRRKFHDDSCYRFLVILLTNKHSYKQTNIMLLAKTIPCRTPQDKVT